MKKFFMWSFIKSSGGKFWRRQISGDRQIIWRSPDFLAVWGYIPAQIPRNLVSSRVRIPVLDLTFGIPRTQLHILLSLKSTLEEMWRGATAFLRRHVTSFIPISIPFRLVPKTSVTSPQICRHSGDEEDLHSLRVSLKASTVIGTRHQPSTSFF